MIQGWRKTFLPIVSHSSAQRAQSDPNAAICYHGWLRVATGFALLQGMIELQDKAEQINIRE